MGVGWLPPAGFGRFPYEYLEEIIRYLAENQDIFELITYDDLPWEDDYNYADGYPDEFKRWTITRNPDKIYIILQHDVDMFPERTLRVLELEKELGLKSSVMIFRWYFDRKYLQETGELKYEDYLIPEVIEALQEYESLGFVIGYHINAYERALFDKEKAVCFFKNDVMELRKFFDIKFCSAHGGAKDHNRKSNFILSVPLDNIRWINNYHNISQHGSYSDGLLLNNIKTIEQFLDECEKGKRYTLLIHPQYYHTPWKDWREE